MFQSLKKKRNLKCLEETEQRKNGRGKRDQQEKSINENVLKLTALHRKRQGMDAAPQHIICLLPWRPNPRVIMRKQWL